MKNWIKQIKRILWEDSFDAVELFGSVNAFGWGIWFLLHPNLFQLGTAYSTLASFADIGTYGCMFIFLGLLKLYGIMTDRYLIRKWVSLVATFVWAFMLITFWQGNPGSLIVLINGEILVYSVWEFFRHARRHEIRKEIRTEIQKGIL